MNRYKSDKLCRHLIETEKSGPPLLQTSISMESLQINGKLGKSSNVSSKGQRDAYLSIRKNGETMNYSFLALTCSPPSMHPRGSIYIPSIGSEGLIRSVSRHMEGQESSYLGHIEENSIYFVFMHISQCMRATVKQRVCTHGF